MSIAFSKYISFLETPLGQSLFQDVHFEIGRHLLFDLEEWKIRSDQQGLIIRFTHDLAIIREHAEEGNIDQSVYVDAIESMNVKKHSFFKFNYTGYSDSF